MDVRNQFGVLLVITGLVIVAAGLLIVFAGKIPFIGRLPGDVSFHGRNWSVHLPLMSGLVISLILTILLNLFLRR